ncbi:MAG TPA: hypothetical protein PLU17_03920 [Chitinophagaceae bacterium]|nr:hypothetical protein [Chitinophagaceae bacterium]
MLQQFLEILKYILPAIVVLISTTMIVNKFLKKETERKRIAIFEQNSKASLQMRLQAYERLVIFLERMHPSSMINRYYTSGISAQDLHLAMVQGIRAEYEHNLSQQVYVSNTLWQKTMAVKEQMISLLNHVGSGLEAGATSKEFIKNLTEYVLMSESELPTTEALKMMNDEAKSLMVIPA